MKVFQNILETIGNTPLVKLNRFHPEQNVYVKVESFNPGGSVKDRVAYHMIRRALEENRISYDTTIIEPTSGNTGIGLAMVAASLGLKCIIVMPDSMSVERRRLMEAYGAQVILTEGKLGMKGAIAYANQLQKEILHSFIPQQFENPNNPNMHLITTGEEIYRDLDGQIDVFVAGVGTGGTISGVGEYLKSKNPAIKIVAVEPTESAVLSTGKAGKHKIQGIGAGFVPQNVNCEVIDEILTVTSEQAFEEARNIAQNEGILVGISSGAALAAARIIANRSSKKLNIVVLLPDTGERYLSTECFVK